MRWWWLILGLLVLTAGVAAALWLRGPQWRFAQAQRQWQTQAAQSYRLSYLHRYTLGDFLGSDYECQATVAVRPGQAPQLLAGDCPELLSVDAIFARFALYASQAVPSRRCGYGTCLCTVSTFQAAYDPQRGFPRTIARDWNDYTVGRGRFWSLAANLPAPLRNSLRDFAEQRSPCPPGTLNHTPNISPIHRESIEILVLEPLDAAP